MKKQYCNSSLKNKRGFIFTMDVAIALVIVFVILVGATAFITKSNKDPFPNLQLLKYGTDVVRVLDYKGHLESPDGISIENKLQEYVPNYYGMELTGIGSGSCPFYANNGELPPDKKTIVSGKYYHNSENNVCTIQFKIWLK